jgi:Clp amino terminal domain, pathogenicity island component
VSALDLAGLVLVAARTLGLEAEAVLGLADLEGAAAVLAEARDAPGGPEGQAATLLAGLVRRQVFGPRSGEVALLAALQLLALAGREAGDLGPPAAVRELLAGVAAGRVGTEDLASWLERSTSERRTEMFERFSSRARNAVRLAQEETRRLGHTSVGTEHLLLGLLSEPEGLGARALVAVGVPLDGLRAEVERTIGRGEGAPAGHLPFQPRSKKVLELALREALQLGCNYIGTEHILLGLVREGEGVAAQVLVGPGVDLPTLRQEVMRLFAVGANDVTPGPPRERLIADIEALYEEIVRLSREVHRLTELLREHGIEPDEGTSRSA